jgi:outer membrane receptor protein involved in Fe transport
MLAEGPLAGGRGAWLATIRRSYLNWLLHQIDPETDAAALGFLDSQSRVVFDLSGTQQVQMSVIAGRAGYDEHDETPGANSLRDADSHTVVVTAGLRSIVGNTMLLQRVGYVSQGFDNTGEFSQPLGEGRIREWIYNVGAATRVSSRMLVEGGVEVRRQHESRVLRSFARQGSGVVPAGEDAFDGDGWLPAAHAQLTWQVSPSLVVSPGVRVAHSSLVDEPTINPWMQVLWRHGRFDVKAGAGEYPQFPEFDQVLGASGTRTLGAERAAHVDLTIGATMGGLRWQAAGYYRRERDMIRLEDSEPVLFGDRLVMPIAAAYENALDGSARGVELSVEGRVRALSGWISYAYGRASHTDRLTGESFWSDYDQRHTINLVGRYRLPKALAFGMKWRYGSNVPVGGYYLHRDGAWFLTDRRNVSRFPTYSRVDVRADRVFTLRGSRVTLFAEVVNLFDRTNLGPSDPSIRARTLEAVRVTETLMPRVPAVGVTIGF